MVSWGRHSEPPRVRLDCRTGEPSFAEAVRLPATAHNGRRVPGSRSGPEASPKSKTQYCDSFLLRSKPLLRDQCRARLWEDIRFVGLLLKEVVGQRIFRGIELVFFNHFVKLGTSLNSSVEMEFGPGTAVSAGAESRSRRA